jgi:dTDP-4-dehydrorhamnose reductase
VCASRVRHEDAHAGGRQARESRGMHLNPADPPWIGDIPAKEQDVCYHRGVKILLIGRDGQVGLELASHLASRGEVTALGRRELDLADLDAVRARVAEACPELIINAAAYNAVDRAEEEPQAAMRINAEAVGLLGELATERDAALIHYSTDFVFDGTKGSAYTEDDPPAPLSAYGRSKLAGEGALVESAAPAIVLRTAWVYSLGRKSFVSMILSLAREREELKIVTDQVGSPTWARDLARATVAIVDRLGAAPGLEARRHRGVYHAAGGGSASRFELAEAILALDPRAREHRVKRLLPVPSEAFPTPARRPARAVLDCSRLERTFGVRLPEWRSALAEALRGLPPDE